MTEHHPNSGSEDPMIRAMNDAISTMGAGASRGGEASVRKEAPQGTRFNIGTAKNVRVVTERFSAGEGKPDPQLVNMYGESGQRIFYGSTLQQLQGGNGIATIHYDEGAKTLSAGDRLDCVRAFAYLAALEARSRELDIEVDVAHPTDPLGRDPVLGQDLLDLGFTDPYGDNYFANTGDILDRFGGFVIGEEQQA
jgi:hypothetical protein